MSNRDLLLRILDDAFPNHHRGTESTEAPLCTLCLCGDIQPSGSFPRRGSNWLPPGKSWPDDLRLLAEEHRALRSAIVQATSRQLTKLEKLIYGVAAHDAYHTGQIQLIKRLQA